MVKVVGGKSIGDVVGEAVVYRHEPQRGTLVGAVW